MFNEHNNDTNEQNINTLSTKPITCLDILTNNINYVNAISNIQHDESIINPSNDNDSSNNFINCNDTDNNKNNTDSIKNNDNNIINTNYTEESDDKCQDNTSYRKLKRSKICYRILLSKTNLIKTIERNRPSDINNKKYSIYIVPDDYKLYEDSIIQPYIQQIPEFYMDYLETEYNENALPDPYIVKYVPHDIIIYGTYFDNKSLNYYEKNINENNVPVGCIMYKNTETGKNILKPVHIIVTDNKGNVISYTNLIESMIKLNCTLIIRVSNTIKIFCRQITTISGEPCEISGITISNLELAAKAYNEINNYNITSL